MTIPEPQEVRCSSLFRNRQRREFRNDGDSEECETGNTEPKSGAASDNPAELGPFLLLHGIAAPVAKTDWALDLHKRGCAWLSRAYHSAGSSGNALLRLLSQDVRIQLFPECAVVLLACIEITHLAWFEPQDLVVAVERLPCRFALRDGHTGIGRSQSSTPPSSWPASAGVQA